MTPSEPVDLAGTPYLSCLLDESLAISSEKCCYRIIFENMITNSKIEVRRDNDANKGNDSQRIAG